MRAYNILLSLFMTPIERSEKTLEYDIRSIEEATFHPVLKDPKDVVEFAPAIHSYQSLRSKL